jgi:hypothetical protein
VSKMVMYTWGPALAPPGLTATTSVLRTPVRKPPCWPPAGLLDCTSGHQLPRQPWRPSEGPALPSRPSATPGAGRLTTGQSGALPGLLASGGVRAPRVWACSVASCPVSLVGGGGTRDDRRRPGHRGSRVHGRAGVDGRCGLHWHTPMGPWGQVDVCPGLATCVSERRKMLLCLNGEKYRKNAGESSGHQEGRCSTVGEHEAKVIPLESEAFYWRWRKQMVGLAPLVSLIPSGLWESMSMGRYCGKCGREVQAVSYSGEGRLSCSGVSLSPLRAERAGGGFSGGGEGG